MSSQPTRRYFSVAEANALLEVIKPKLDELTLLYRKVVWQYAEFTHNGISPRLEDGLPDDPEELQAKRIELRDMGNSLQEGIDELNGLGCEVKDLESGLVDFLSRRAGSDVLLCWRRGEEEIAFWHDLEAGFRGRKPIDAAAEFEGSYLH